MNAVAAFVVRLAAYAILLGLAARLADALWNRRGLDGALELQSAHDTAVTILAIAPIPLALLGTGLPARIAVFVAGFLIGAALTAPLAFARFAGV